MKRKIISILLCIVIALVYPVSCLAFDSNPDCDIPIVVISGDSSEICDKDGNGIYQSKNFKNMAKKLLQDGETYTDVIVRIMKGIFLTYYAGCITGNFDNYYDVMYNIALPVFEEVRCDGNGNAQNGTDIAQWYYDATNSNLGSNPGSYNLRSYRFYYDWRLDPFETAEKLNAYIKQIKSDTGYDKIGVICRCLGANVFLAYVSKYGMNDICGVGFDGVTVNGSELLGETISGGLSIDLNSIKRFLLDYQNTGHIDIDEKIPVAIEALSDSGIFDIVKFCIKFPNYSRLEKGVTSAMALSTFYTWPNYWASVPAESFDTAVNYVFGEEGSELRTEYAGLIEKIERYEKDVKEKIPELLNEINDNANFAIISKYGMQSVVISKSNSLVGDQIVSAKRSSFGATTSTIYEPLSDEYIQNVIDAGNGKYISPDKQIDASTCLFPDQTFFIKGSSHSDWTNSEMSLLVKIICADKQLTINDLPDNQFMVYDYTTDSVTAMTTENCNTEAWTAEKSETSKNPFVKMIRFGKSIYKLAQMTNAE